MRKTLLLLGMLAAHAAAAQTHFVRGAVKNLAGSPIAGAEAFLLESLDAATTDSSGHFSIRTTATGRVTLVARHLGFGPATLIVPVDTAAILDITLHSQAAVLVPITVQAGAYTAGNERGMTLTALEVVTTPGATADVARAMQTLPGVQSVDEGTGLFVRGGDVSETKVLLNNTVMLSPYNYETPTGNYTATVNPFLLDGIFFSSGGFGARYGNILSGVADLRTAARPAVTSFTGTAGLASVSGEADLALAHDVGVRATAARNDLDPLFRLNGATRSYSPAPRGNDYSGSVIYNYRPTGEIKAFAIDRASKFGIGVDDPSFNGGYASDGHNSMTQAGWKDVFGSFAPTISVSYSTDNQNQRFGPFTLGDTERWSQLFAQTAWTATDRLTFRGGGDLDWRDARFVGSVPMVSAFDSHVAGGRNGAFAEADLRVLEDIRVIAGIRTDRSTFTGTRTADPRLSVAYILGDGTLTAAAGEYHQVSDPLYFASGLGSSTALAPMRARQHVVGGQLGEDKRMVRLELYDKHYDDLVGLTRAKLVVGGGTGEARGADLFVRHELWPFASIRWTLSLVDSRRTDPDTRIVTVAPFDITHSTTLVFDQALPKGFSFSAAFRHAAGKPYTPVNGATFDADRQLWIPEYGVPNSLRLPAYAKTDIALSRYTKPSPTMTVVYFASVDNIFDRDNLSDYTYSSDYKTRIPIRSLFNRSFYFGFSLTHVEN